MATQKQLSSSAISSWVCLCIGCVFATTPASVTAQSPARSAAAPSASRGCEEGAPENDDCDFAANLTSIATHSVPFDTTCATRDGSLAVDCPDAVNVGSDLWYTYQAPCNGTLRLSTCDTANFDAMITVHSYCFCVSFDPHFCGNDTCGVAQGPAEVIFEAEAGRCYAIRVAGVEGSTGSGILELNYDTICDPTPAIPQPNSQDDNAVRFIETRIPPADYPDLNEVAIRVNLTTLHRVIPPYTAGPSVPFTAFQGQVRWAGPPQEYQEGSTNPATILVSQLQCEPHYQVWHDLEFFHITGSAIVPSSIYHLQTVSSNCLGNEEGCATVSAPIEFRTTRWGDVFPPYNPPSAVVTPDIIDVAALVNKFRVAPNAITKARALIAGNAMGVINPGVDLDFSHISQAVDAYRGLPYPYTIATCP